MPIEDMDAAEADAGRDDSETASIARRRRWLFDRALPEPNSGCWLITSDMVGGGYSRLKYKGKRQLAHRMAYELWCGPIPPGLVVMHKCDTPACCNPDHLKLGTQKDNVAECHAKGRASERRGAANNVARLTEDAVRDIKARRISATAYAAHYGVSVAAVYKVLDGSNWGWLE